MTKRAPASPVTRYFTRNFPITLRERARAWATVHNLTLEDAINKLVEAGLDHLTGTSGKAASK